MVGRLPEKIKRMKSFAHSQLRPFAKKHFLGASPLRGRHPEKKKEKKKETYILRRNKFNVHAVTRDETSQQSVHIPFATPLNSTSLSLALFFKASPLQASPKKKRDGEE